MTPEPDDEARRTRDQYEADLMGDLADLADSHLEDAGTWTDPYKGIDWQLFRVRRKRGDRE